MEAGGVGGCYALGACELGAGGLGGVGEDAGHVDGAGATFRWGGHSDSPAHVRPIRLCAVVAFLIFL